MLEIYTAFAGKGALQKAEEEANLFCRISDQEREKLLCCIPPEYKNYLAGECILDFQNRLDRIAVMLSGKAQVVSYDVVGNRIILEQLTKNDIFGEVFLLPLSSHGYAVEALCDCRVLFLQYKDVIKRCEKACAYHSQLVDNLFCLSAIKVRGLNAHLQILSQRSIGDKLLSYFSFIAAVKGNTFEMPMTWSSLSDYLCVNRSALMRGLRQLRENNLIAVDGKRVTLL